MAFLEGLERGRRGRKEHRLLSHHASILPAGFDGGRAALLPSQVLDMSVVACFATHKLLRCMYNTVEAQVVM